MTEIQPPQLPIEEKKMCECGVIFDEWDITIIPGIKLCDACIKTIHEYGLEICQDCKSDFAYFKLTFEDSVQYVCAECFTQNEYVDEIVMNEHFIKLEKIVEEKDEIKTNKLESDYAMLVKESEDKESRLNAADLLSKVNDPLSADSDNEEFCASLDEDILEL